MRTNVKADNAVTACSTEALTALTDISIKDRSL